MISSIVYNGNSNIPVSSTSSSSSSSVTNVHKQLTTSSTTSVTGAFTATSTTTSSAESHILYDANGNVIGNLVPDQSETSTDDDNGYVLTTNGSIMKWNSLGASIASRITSSDGSIVVNQDDEGTDLTVNVTVDSNVVNVASWVCTIPIGMAGGVSPDSYASNSTYRAYGTMFYTAQAMRLTTSSLAMTKLIQGTLSDAYFAIYSVGSTSTLICQSSAFSCSSASIVQIAPTQSDVILDAGTAYYAVLLSKDNGWKILGFQRSSTSEADTKPYINPYTANLTIDNKTCPLTIKWDGYDTNSISFAWQIGRFTSLSTS